MKHETIFIPAKNKFNFLKTIDRCSYRIMTWKLSRTASFKAGILDSLRVCQSQEDFIFLLGCQFQKDFAFLLNLAIFGEGVGDVFGELIRHKL
jgi:hypothetical protein